MAELLQTIDEFKITIHFEPDRTALYEVVRGTAQGKEIVYFSKDQGECIRMATALSSVRKAISYNKDYKLCADAIARQIDAGLKDRFSMEPKSPGAPAVANGKPVAVLGFDETGGAYWKVVLDGRDVEKFETEEEANKFRDLLKLEVHDERPQPTT